VLCGAFSIALALGVIALIPPNLRHHAIEQSKQQLLATATVLAWQAARELQSSDLIEAKLIEYMETLAIVSDELHARAMVGRGLHLMLKGQDRRLFSHRRGCPSGSIHWRSRLRQNRTRRSQRRTD
jgi:hypothetical protein